MTKIKTTCSVTNKPAVTTQTLSRRVTGLVATGAARTILYACLTSRVTSSSDKAQSARSRNKTRYLDPASCRLRRASR